MSHCRCAHWRSAGVDDEPGTWGECAAGVYRGPSLGTCEACARYDGPRPRVVRTPPVVRPADAAAPASGAPPAPQAPAPAVGPETWGPAYWARLHAWAAAFKGTPAEAAAWLAAFAASLPGGCACRAHWRAVLAARPFDAADPFGWSVAAHDDVSAGLGRPAFGLEAARAAYGAGESTHFWR